MFEGVLEGLSEMLAGLFEGMGGVCCIALGLVLLVRFFLGGGVLISIQVGLTLIVFGSAINGLAHQADMDPKYMEYYAKPDYAFQALFVVCLYAIPAVILRGHAYWQAAFRDDDDGDW